MKFQYMKVNIKILNRIGLFVNKVKIIISYCDSLYSNYLSELLYKKFVLLKYRNEIAILNRKLQDHFIHLYILREKGLLSIIELDKP